MTYCGKCGAQVQDGVKFCQGSVIEDYKTGKITYAEAEFNARVKIYQSINPSFNPDIEFAKDPIYRDIPPVDNSLFAIARKLILESK